MARRRRPPRAGALNELPPRKILTQIIALQLIYYSSAFALILFSALVAGEHFSLDLILDWQNLRGDTTVGWMLSMVWMLNSIVGVVAILVLIHRSKFVLDFSLTLHAIHFLTVSFYTRSLPRNALWWALQTASAAMMTVLGMWSCQRRELKPISFGRDQSITGTAHNSETRNDQAEMDSGREGIKDGIERFEMMRMSGSGSD
ncbi:BgTH12-00394 [Blumeria graminis f. sp. triticale]|uniref:Bgt-2275 n=3 Tax=Blumeria graminis TaxID=34373 RepID=A0A061HP36_BLUGR|nr:Integral membrane protein [Blumeria graminis f. sp. tritici 96224]CAD6504893.1 BgTH12-00394 [Blumeria graminis f. sp. triticale]VDB92913.1 Bgt-2275 [Blumeria graminis f. sp. tritici]